MKTRALAVLQSGLFLCLQRIHYVIVSDRNEKRNWGLRARNGIDQNAIFNLYILDLKKGDACVYD